MSCYHPMVLIKTSKMSDPEQRKIADILRMRHLGEGKSVSTYLIPREVAIGEGIKLNSDNAVLVPCGHCIGCRLDYSRQWAERCVHEANSHDFNYFLSLTYDDDHLPKGSKGIATLLQDEISSFMKRLRKKLGSGIRFFGCGEYGTPGVGSRVSHPHYHIILFNCNIPDLQERHPIMVDGKLKWIFQYADDGTKLLWSKTVASCWCDKKGNFIGTCEIGQVTYESCAYVARYIVKKQLGSESQQYRDCGILPPYVRMSRMPGIGYDWYDQHYEQLFVYDNYIFKRGDKAFPVKPGRYFDKIVKNRDVQGYYERKEKRHQDFYDSVDCKAYEGVDLVDNNHRAEVEKIRQSKLLKRN